MSHPEVVVDPAVRIQEWGLSPSGRARAACVAALFPQPLRIVSSNERKALDTAEIVAGRWGTEFEVDEDLGEMDRSATGHLDPSDFEPTVDTFFAERSSPSAAGNARSTRRPASSTPSDASRHRRPSGA